MYSFVRGHSWFSRGLRVQAQSSNAQLIEMDSLRSRHVPNYTLQASHIKGVRWSFESENSFHFGFFPKYLGTTAQRTMDWKSKSDRIGCNMVRKFEASVWLETHFIISQFPIRSWKFCFQRQLEIMGFEIWVSNFTRSLKYWRENRTRKSNFQIDLQNSDAVKIRLGCLSGKYACKGTAVSEKNSPSRISLFNMELSAKGKQNGKIKLKGNAEKYALSQ